MNVFAGPVKLNSCGALGSPDGGANLIGDVAVGSATVAITTSASLMAPIAAAVPGTNPALLVVSMGAGSLIASHVNDGGFWVVKQYFNLTVTETLKIWTVLETIVSIVALVIVLLLSAIA